MRRTTHEKCVAVRISGSCFLLNNPADLDQLLSEVFDLALKVLIVDDNTGLRGMIRRVLPDLAAEINETDDVESAFDACTGCKTTSWFQKEQRYHSESIPTSSTSSRWKENK